MDTFSFLETLLLQVHAEELRENRFPKLCLRCYKMLQEGKRRREKLKISGEGVLELSLGRCTRIGQEHHWRKRFFKERD